jgi:hypothetical protein
VVARLIVSFWFRAALSAAVVIYLLAQFDRQETVRALLGIDPRYLLGAIVVDFGARAVMIARWTLLLRSSRTRISFWSAARIFLMTSFAGTALPAGGADVARAYVLARQTDDGPEAIASVAVDRLLGVTALLVLAVVGLTLWTDSAALPQASLVAVLSGVAAVGLLAAFWTGRLLRLLLPGWVRKTRPGRWLTEAADRIERYRGRRAILVTVFGLSLVAQWLRIVEVFLLGSGLAIGVDLSYYLVFMPVGLLAFMLPISIAGIGLPQGVIVWLLGPVGVPEPQAFALSTLVVVVGLVGTLPGLWLYLRSRRL